MPHPTNVDEAPGLGRLIATAAAASTSVVLVTVTAALLANGTPFATALAIGAFAALWGGGGFGAMIGGVLHAHRTEHPVLAPVGPPAPVEAGAS